MASPSLSEAIHTNGRAKPVESLYAYISRLFHNKRKVAVEVCIYDKKFLAIVHKSLCHVIHEIAFLHRINGYCGHLCSILYESLYIQYFHFCWDLTLDT